MLYLFFHHITNIMYVLILDSVLGASAFGLICQSFRQKVKTRLVSSEMETSNKGQLKMILHRLKHPFSYLYILCEYIMLVPCPVGQITVKLPSF